MNPGVNLDWDDVLLDSFEPATDEMLDAFERGLEVELPDDYRSFLKKHNGGRPRWRLDLPTNLLEEVGSPAVWVERFYALGSEVDESYKFRLDYGWEPLTEADAAIEDAAVENGNPSRWLLVTESSHFRILLAIAGPFQGEWHFADTGCFVRSQMTFTQILAELRPDDYAWDEIPLLPFRAIASGDDAAFEAYLAGGGDPNLKDEEGTPLIVEAARQPKLLKWLIDSGADVNLADARGETALHNAGRSPTATALLLEAGANPNAKSVRGFHAVTGASDIRVLKILLDSGADLRDPDCRCVLGRGPKFSRLLAQYGYDFSQDIEVVRGYIEASIAGEKEEHGLYGYLLDLDEFARPLIPEIERLASVEESEWNQAFLLKLVDRLRGFEFEKFLRDR